jgi:hypothetical protein
MTDSEVRDRLSKLREMSAAMAEDHGLWFQAETAAEAYVQQEFRKLCALIEAPLPEERLDCPGVKGMPFTHLFISRQGKPAYCARCGLLETEYKKESSADERDGAVAAQRRVANTPCKG